MADNINNDNVRLNQGTGGALVATDVVNVNGLTSHAQYVKLAFGGSGSMNLVGDATDTGATSGVSSKPLPVKMFSSNNRVFSSTNWTGSSDALDVYLRGAGITIDANLSYQDTNFIAVAGSCSGTTPISVAGDSGGAPVPIRVGVSGSANTMYIQGTGGGTPVGVCATDLDIRGITLNWHAPSHTGTGDVLGVYLLQGLSSGASGAGGTGIVDSVAVQGICGGYPVWTALRGTTGAVGFAGVGVHAGSAGLTGAELLVRLASQGVTIGVDGHFNRILGGGELAVFATKSDLPHGFTGTYGGTYDHVGIQGISNGMPVRSQIGAYTNSGFTAFGHSGDALLVSLKDGIAVTANVSSTNFTVTNKASGVDDAEYLMVAGNTSGTGFVPIAGNTAGTLGLTLQGPLPPIKGVCTAVGITTTHLGVDYPLNIRGLTAYANGQGDWVGITGTVNFRGLTAYGSGSGDYVGVTGSVVAYIGKSVTGITATINGFTSGTYQVGIRNLRCGPQGGTSDIVGISGCLGITATANGVYAPLDVRGLTFTQGGFRDTIQVIGFTGPSIAKDGASAVQRGLSGMPSLVYTAAGVSIGSSGDAMLVSLKEGVNVTANITGTDFNINGVNPVANMVGLPTWQLGMTGDRGGNAHNSMEVVGVLGQPVVVGGTSGHQHPIKIDVVGITAKDIAGDTTTINNYSLSGITGAIADNHFSQGKNLEALVNTLRGTTGNAWGGMAGILQAFPEDIGDADGRKLPSKKQIQELINAFSQDTSDGDSFIDVLDEISNDTEDLQQTVVNDGTINVGVNLRKWKSQNELKIGAVQISTLGATTTTKYINGAASINIDGAVKIKAHPENDGVVYLAASDNIASANWKTSAYPLEPGEELFIEISDINMVAVGSSTGTNVVSWCGSQLND